MGALLSWARSPVEDGLVVVEQLRVAEGVHVGACLQADTMRTQATGVVQVLGKPVQVPVQPVGVAHVSQALERGWRGRQGLGQKQGVPRWVEMPEEGNGVVGRPAFFSPLVGNFEQVNCGGQDGSVAFPLVQEPLGRQGRVSRPSSASTSPAPRPPYIHTNSGRKFLFVVAITFLGFVWGFWVLIIKIKTALTCKKHDGKTNSLSPHQSHSPEGATVPACPPDTAYIASTRKITR